jgi:RNA polymerase sigma factor (TIGR02999 family)
MADMTAYENEFVNGRTMNSLYHSCFRITKVPETETVMAADSHRDITVLLRRISSGDRSAEEALLPVIYTELKRIASRHLRGERSGHTLQTTDLVHEAYIKLVPGALADWESRNHFFAMAARVMRNILVDRARRNSALKRGGNRPADVPLDQGLAFGDDSRPESILALNDALERLEKQDARQSKIVEMRFFGGMTEEEIAQVLGVSSRTVKREWVVAKAWLYGELAP